MKYLSKKGELTDMFFFLVVIFILAAGFLIIIFAVPYLTNGLRVAGLNNSAEGINAIDKLDEFPQIINNGFMFLFVGLVMSMFITSFLVRSHPIFLFLYILFLIIDLLLAVFIGNAYNSVENNPIFSVALSQAGYLHWVMNYIFEITLAIAAVSMVIVFAKFNTSGGSNQF